MRWKKGESGLHVSASVKNFNWGLCEELFGFEDLVPGIGKGIDPVLFIQSIFPFTLYKPA